MIGCNFCKTDQQDPSVLWRIHTSRMVQDQLIYAGYLRIAGGE
jgi:hypothetical protein